MDISENGRQIGEKLLVLLNAEQRKELKNYILNEKEQTPVSVGIPCTHSNGSAALKHSEPPLTVIQENDLYFCLELRKVCIGDTEIELTVKEFDALHLLLANRSRVLTFEIIAYHVWGEEYIDITSKTIHNLMSRLRQKLQTKPNSPNYIVCVRGVGYKFDTKT